MSKKTIPKTLMTPLGNNNSGFGNIDFDTIIKMKCQILHVVVQYFRCLIDEECVVNFETLWYNSLR